MVIHCDVKLLSGLTCLQSVLANFMTLQDREQTKSQRRWMLSARAAHVVNLKHLADERPVKPQNNAQQRDLIPYQIPL